MLVDGRLVEATSGASYETYDPATEELIAEVPAATPRDVAAAVEAGKRAFESWRRVDARERARRVRALAELVVEHEEELGGLDSLNGGNPIAAMRGDVALAGELMELAADSARELKGQTTPSSDHLHYTEREPFGVVARIIPYNHPLLFAAAKIAPPLIAGNTVVLKTPDQTPLSGLRMAELFADELPPGVLAVLSGIGTVAGDALVRHPDVRRIAFIGSVATGRAIQRAAAESGVKHVTLELGGKNPLIVFPDADLAAASAAAVRGMNFHATGGQSCGSTSRVLAHESVVDELVERVCDGARRIALGDPLEPMTEMGAMVSKAQFDKVLGYVERGRDEGAELVTGGNRPDAFERGFFVAPTVFSGVTADMAIAQDEIFGPVLSVLTWRDEDEAVAIANGTAYGLTASVWTEDLRRAHRVARRLEAGYVWVNTVGAHYPGVPFGGVKDSGIGREEDLEELLSFTQLKAINVSLAGGGGL